MVRSIPSTTANSTPCWALLALLRFFLALIVACGHLQWFSGADIEWAHLLGQFGGKAAVIGFLLVSGFSIAASQQARHEGFLRRRALRIYPLYVCGIVFAFWLELHFHRIELPRITFEGLGWTTFVGNLFLLQTFAVRPIAFNGPVWSLSIEFFFYLMATQLPRLQLKVLLAVVVVSIVCFLLPRREDLGLVYWFASKFNALKYLWCWLAGYVFWHHRSPTSTALLLCGAAVVALSEDATGSLDAVTYALTVVVMAGSFWVSVKGAAAKVLEFLGDFSYPLYLFHLPAFLFAYAGLGITGPELLMLTALVLSLFFLLVIEYFVKPRYLRVLFLGRTG